jgi:hypothetical protein
MPAGIKEANKQANRLACLLASKASKQTNKLACLLASTSKQANKQASNPPPYPPNLAQMHFNRFVGLPVWQTHFTLILASVD